MEALRKRGRWVGPVVLLTDQPRCLAHLRGRGGGVQLGATVVPVSLDSAGEQGRAAAEAWLLSVKALKTRLFELITPEAAPGSEHWERLLYLDVDVWAARPVEDFLRDAAPYLPEEQQAGGGLQEHSLRGSLVLESKAHSTWLVLFEDCAAHAVGWCSGCDTWNTGVMVVPRNAASHICLARWRGALESGEFPTDQEALESVALGAKARQSKGYGPSAGPECEGVVAMAGPSRHLLFLKDYLALPAIALWRGWPTWCHVTAANRIESQDPVYRKLASFLHGSLDLRAPFDAQVGGGAGQC